MSEPADIHSKSASEALGPGEPSRGEAIGLWVVLGVLAASFLFGLNAREPWNNAEARVLIVAQGMLDSGDWLRPTLFGHPRHNKPPLMYWATLGVAALQGGLRETSAYWISALSAVASILALAAAVWRIAGARAGAMAGIMLALSPGVLEYGREAQLDSLFSACSTISLLAFALWIFRIGRWPAAWIPLAGAALGLGALAKGPHALTFAFGPPLVYLALRRRLDWKAGATLLGALLIGLAAPGAWLALTEWRNPGYLADVWRIIGKEAGGTNLEPFWYYIDKAVGWTLPWLLLVPALWPRKAERAEKTAADELARFFATGFLLGFIILSALPGKQRHYILPLMPSAMGWIALRLEARLRQGEGLWRWRQRWVAWAGLALAAGAAIGFPSAYWVASVRSGFRAAAGPFLLILAPSAAGLAVAFAAFRRRSLAGALSGGALAWTSCVVFYVTAVCPAKNIEESPRAACREMLRIAPDPSELMFYSKLRELTAYWLGGLRPEAKTDSQAREFMSRPQPSYMLFSGSPGEVADDSHVLDGLGCRTIRQFRPFTGRNREALLFANEAGARRAGLAPQGAAARSGSDGASGQAAPAQGL